MNKRSRLQYVDKHSNQTLQQGLEEYYRENPGITNPKNLPSELARILLAHDVCHVVLGCDTSMYDELKLLPISFWTSDFKFKDYLDTRKDPAVKPAIDIMYDDLIEQHGVLWLYGSILLALPQLIPNLAFVWFKTRGERKYYPFFNYEPLLDRSLSDIRQEFGLLSLIR